VEHESSTVITVTLYPDGSTELSLPPMEHPVEELRKAAARLEGYAATIERENEPIRCEACGTSPTGIRAEPDGTWQLLPCGHNTEAGAA